MGNLPSDDNDFLEKTEVFQSFRKSSMGNRIDTSRILDGFRFSGKNFDSTDLRSKGLNRANSSGESSSGHY